MHTFASVLPGLLHETGFCVQLLPSQDDILQAGRMAVAFLSVCDPSPQREKLIHLPLTPEIAALYCSCVCFLVQPCVEASPAGRLLVFPPHVWRGLAQPSSFYMGRNSCIPIWCGPLKKRRLVSAYKVSQVFVMSVLVLEKICRLYC